MKEVDPASLFATLKNSSSCLDWLVVDTAEKRVRVRETRTRANVRAIGLVTGRRVRACM